jgi:hypothetical protein
MQSGAGSFIAPAVAGLAGAADPAGAQMMMQGAQQVVQMEAQKQLSQGLRDAMGPVDVPPAADAESAARSTVNNDVVQGQRRVIDTMLEHGDIQGAIKMYTGLSDMMNANNKPMTVSPGHSVYQGGEFQGQAPGTWSAQGGHPVHSTQGVWSEPTAYAQAGMQDKAAGRAIDQQRADAYTKSSEAQASYYGARTAVESVKDGGRLVDPMIALGEFVNSAEGQLMREQDPDQYNKFLAYLQHYDKAWREATGAASVPTTEDIDSTQEGFGATSQGRFSTNPDGSYTYHPPE